MTASELIRESRRSAGLTQAELARRLGTTQPAVARLEAPGSNPTLRSVEDALGATGHRLTLAAEPAPPQFDETLVARNLSRTPAERLRNLEAMYEEGRALTSAGERMRGRRRR